MGDSVAELLQRSLDSQPATDDVAEVGTIIFWCFLGFVNRSEHFFQIFDPVSELMMDQ